MYINKNIESRNLLLTGQFKLNIKKAKEEQELIYYIKF